MLPALLGSAVIGSAAIAIGKAFVDNQDWERGRPWIRGYDDDRDGYPNRQQWRRRYGNSPFPHHHPRHPRYPHLPRHHPRDHEDFHYRRPHRTPPSSPRCTCPHISDPKPQKFQGPDSNLPHQNRGHPARNNAPHPRGILKQHRDHTNPTANPDCTCSQHAPQVPPKIPLSDTTDSDNPIMTPPGSPTQTTSYPSGKPSQPSPPYIRDRSPRLYARSQPHRPYIRVRSRSPRPYARTSVPHNPHPTHVPDKHFLSPSPTEKNPSRGDKQHEDSIVEPWELDAIERMERLDALVRDASEADIERRRERVERMGKGRSGKMKGGKGKGKGGKGKEKGGKGKVEGGGGNEGDGWEMSGGLGM